VSGPFFIFAKWRLAYFFLAAFFFPPLAAFFAMSIPPFSVWITRASRRSIAAHSAAWHVGLDVGDLACSAKPPSRGRAAVRAKKIGVPHLSTPKFPSKN
jgi:hypothetical protein